MEMQTEAEQEVTAAVVHQRGADYVFEKINLGSLKVDEVRIKVLACGICHTDFIAEQLVTLPAVFGHEACGVVEAVGSPFLDLRPGDRVIASYPRCGQCFGCTSGEPYHCDMHMALAFGGAEDGDRSTESMTPNTFFFQQSSFASSCIVKRKNVIKIDGDYASEILAAIPCGVQTGAGAVLNTFKIQPHQSLAVFGTGAVGLSAIMAAKLSGVRPIIGVDVIDERLELASQLGADYVFNARMNNLVDEIKRVTGGGVQFALETSGNEHALNAAILALRTAGKCGMVISPHFGEKYPFSTTEVFKGARSLCGIVQGSSIPEIFLPRILTWYSEGRFPVDRLIRTYDFADINTAARDTKSGKVIKAVLKMQP